VAVEGLVVLIRELRATEIPERRNRHEGDAQYTLF
jgi:hypothetical protein